MFSEAFATSSSSILLLNLLSGLGSFMSSSFQILGHNLTLNFKQKVF